ncbi:hypothetical protein HDU89_008378 [Geranomyces variabilis]|nr:hypothetical protein HDU89_008378 [Geranomyces variabilis]
MSTTPPVAPFDSQVQAGPLWQFGLAIVGGLILIGIPFSCLLSYWARRRLYRHGPDPEMGPAAAQQIGRGPPRRVIKETELKSLPVTLYRSRDKRRQNHKPVVKAEVESEDPDLTPINEEPPDLTLMRKVGSLTTSNAEVTTLDCCDRCDHVDTSSTQSDRDNCPICIEGFAEDEPIRELSCGHYYHCQCIELWLTTRNGICPLCRSEQWAERASE